MGSRLITFALGAIGLLGLSAQSAQDFKVYATLPNSNSVAVIDGLTNTVGKEAYFSANLINPVSGEPVFPIFTRYEVATIFRRLP